MKSLAKYLRATGEHDSECLLQRLIPLDLTKSIFRYNDAESASKQLLKSSYCVDLHFTLGLLHSFDVTQKSCKEGDETYCDFHSATEPMKGAALLEVYGLCLL